MEYKRIECPSCGAPLTVRENGDSIQCDYCCTRLAVERSGNELVLRFAIDVENRMRDIGDKVSSSVEQSAINTQLEIQKLQIQQQIASLENQRFRLNGEIRYVEESYSKNRKRLLAPVRTLKKQKRELKNLHLERERLKALIMKLEEQTSKIQYLLDEQSRTLQPRITFHPKQDDSQRKRTLFRRKEKPTKIKQRRANQRRN